MRKHPKRAIQPSASKCDSRFSTGRRTGTLPFFAIQFCLQLLDLSQQAHKFPAEIGEPVFDARRDFGELDALENPGAGEMTQAVGKDFGADAFDVAFERTGAPHTFGHRPQDADRPTAADHFLKQHFHPARIQFGHGGQKFFIAVRHNFTPICKYPTNFLKHAVTDSVRKAQEHYYGSSPRIASTPGRDALTEDEIAFVQACDSFYMATVSESGWP